MINKIRIGESILSYRRERGLTQGEFGELLGVTAVAVSKWERGESLPDIAVLKNISLLFGVSLDWLTEEEHNVPAPVSEDAEARLKRKRVNHIAITSMSVLLVWLIATAVFVILQAVPAITRLHWLSFVYAMPVSAIVWLVFNSTWFSRRTNYPIISLLMWSLIAALYINLKLCGIGIWQLFLVGIPGQIIIIMWSALRFRKKK